MSLASLYLATKLCEESEKVPSVAEMVQLAGARYSAQELLRMERVLLSRLDWRLSYPTIDKFLQLMLAISLPFTAQTIHLPWLDEGSDQSQVKGPGPGQGQTPSMSMDLWSNLKSVLTSHRLMICKLKNVQDSPRVLDENSHPEEPCPRGTGSKVTLGYRPSLLALSLLSLSLENQGNPEWLTITYNLQQLIKAEADEVIGCRESISARVWADQRPDSADPRYIMVRNPRPLLPASKSNNTNYENLRIEIPTDSSSKWCQGTVLGSQNENSSVKKLGKSPRKRLRKQSKSSDSSSSSEMVKQRPRYRTPPEKICIDEIWDSFFIQQIVATA
jgi:hypothetical protein